MRYVGLVIDVDVLKEMTMEQIIAMHIYKYFKSRYPHVRVRLIKTVKGVSHEDIKVKN